MDNPIRSSQSSDEESGSPDRGSGVADEANPQPAARDDEGLWQSEPPLANHQFRLMSLFALVTAAGVYFGLERMHNGQFALNFLGGVILIVGVVIPAACLVLWLLLAWFDGVSISKTLLAIAIGAGALLGLRQFWGP